MRRSGTESGGIVGDREPGLARVTRKLTGGWGQAEAWTTNGRFVVQPSGCRGRKPRAEGDGSRGDAVESCRGGIRAGPVTWVSDGLESLGDGAGEFWSRQAGQFLGAHFDAGEATLFQFVMADPHVVESEVAKGGIPPPPPCEAFQE